MTMGTITTRPAEARDRATFRLLAGRDGIVDKQGHRAIVVEEDGRVMGVTAFSAPAPPAEPQFGAIGLRDPARLDLFHALVVAVVQAGAALGYRFGVADVRDPAVAAFLATFYGVTPELLGTDTATGGPAIWRFRVDVAATAVSIAALPPPAPISRAP